MSRKYSAAIVIPVNRRYWLLLAYWRYWQSLIRHDGLASCWSQSVLKFGEYVGHLIATLTTADIDSRYQHWPNLATWC